MGGADTAMGRVLAATLEGGGLACGFSGGCVSLCMSGRGTPRAVIARRRQGVGVGNMMVSRINRPVVKTGVSLGKRPKAKSVASVRKGFALRIPRGTMLMVSCVKCLARRVPIRKGTSFGVRVGRSAGALSRIMIMNCNSRGGRAMATSTSALGMSSLGGIPATGLTSSLNKHIDNMLVRRANNRTKCSSPAVVVHKSDSPASSSPLVMISNVVKHDVSRLSPDRVRDVAMLGSTSTMTPCNTQKTGNMVLVAAGHNGDNGTRMSCGFGVKFNAPAHVPRVTDSCSRTHFVGST